MSSSFPILCYFDVGLLPVAGKVYGTLSSDDVTIATTTTDIMLAAFLAGGLPVRRVVISTRLGKSTRAVSSTFEFDQVGNTAPARFTHSEHLQKPYTEWHVETGVYGWTPPYLALTSEKEVARLTTVYGAGKVESWMRQDPANVLIGAVQKYCTEALGFREAHPSLPVSPAFRPARLYRKIDALRDLDKRVRAQRGIKPDEPMDPVGMSALIGFTGMWQNELNSPDGKCLLACADTDAEVGVDAAGVETGQESGSAAPGSAYAYSAGELEDARSEPPTFGYMSTSGVAQHIARPTAARRRAD
jgi:hypothetical protein